MLTLWGGDIDRHDFCCSSNSSFSVAALYATTVNMLTIFEWEGGGEGGGKEDGDCVDKDGDGVQLILSSTATTMTALVLMSETVANNDDLGMDGRTDIVQGFGSRQQRGHEDSACAPLPSESRCSPKRRQHRTCHDCCRGIT